MWASMTRKRRNVSAGMRGPSCGTSRSRQVRMKFCRQPRLLPPSAARKLSGKPPRIQSLSGASCATSSTSNGDNSGYAMRTGQRLPRLLQEVHGRQAEQQEAPCPLPLASTAIDEPAKALKQLRQAMNFIEYHELILMIGKIEFRIGEFCPVCWRLEVQVNGLYASGHLERQGRLAGLSRSPDGTIFNRRAAAGLVTPVGLRPPSVTRPATSLFSS